MKFSIIPLSVLLIILSTGCASHSTMRGGVAMKINEREAHVCLGAGEVKEGDTVLAYYNDCQDQLALSSKSAGAYGVPCVKKKLGSGTIIKVLNEHYSVVQFQDGLNFTEGTFVEKQK